MTRFEDRLMTLESLLGSVISQTTSNIRIQSGFNSASHLTDSDQPADNALLNGFVVGTGSLRSDKTLTQTHTNSDIADDTVDGMGIITFADEFASGYFGGIFLRLFQHTC